MALGCRCIQSPYPESVATTWFYFLEDSKLSDQDWLLLCLTRTMNEVLFTDSWSILELVCVLCEEIFDRVSVTQDPL